MDCYRQKRGLFSVLLFSLIISITADLIAENQKHEIQLNSFKRLTFSDNNWIDFGTIRMTKLKRNVFTLSGEIEAMRNLGNNQRIVVSLYTISVAVNSKIPIWQKELPFCDFVLTDKLFYPELEKSGFPRHDVCPFPKGKYTVKNLVMNAEGLPKQISAGNYILSLTIFDEKKPVAGVEVDVTLVSKESLL